MKQKVSLSLEDSTLIAIATQLKEGTYRNRSHLVEFAIKKLLEEK